MSPWDYSVLLIVLLSTDDAFDCVLKDFSRAPYQLNVRVRLSCSLKLFAIPVALFFVVLLDQLLNCVCALVFEGLRNIYDAVERGEQLMREGVCQLALKACPVLQLLLLDDVIDVSNQDESRCLATVIELFHLDLEGDFIGRLRQSRCTFILNSLSIGVVKLNFTLWLLLRKFVNATSCPTFHDNFLKTHRLFG